ncbi:hypothetical protein [uncultured Kingella sp.]|nr:hypothetical protein [uncultured Kingella sp.]
MRRASFQAASSFNSHPISPSQGSLKRGYPFFRLPIAENKTHPSCPKP